MGTKQTVLIVDDDRDYVEATGEILELGGYQVVKAYNVRDGLEAAKTHRPALILLDVMMEERTSGYDLAHQLRGSPELKNVPVIIISSLYHEGPGFALDPAAGHVPAALFLPKPVDPQKLISEAQRLIAAAK